MNDWVSTEDRLPDPHTRVDIWVADPQHDRIADCVWTGREWRRMAQNTPIDEEQNGNVTHWMPFPEPPEMQL